MTQTAALLVSRSSHPEFDLFASLDIHGRQIAKRGSRAEIEAWANQVIYACDLHEITLTIIDHTS